MGKQHGKDLYDMNTNMYINKVDADINAIPSENRCCIRNISKHMIHNVDDNPNVKKVFFYTDKSKNGIASVMVNAKNISESEYPNQPGREISGYYDITFDNRREQALSIVSGYKNREPIRGNLSMPATEIKKDHQSWLANERNSTQLDDIRSLQPKSSDMQYN